MIKILFYILILKIVIMLKIILENWKEVIAGFLAFAEILVRLTPTEKDDSILNFLVKIFSFIVPNKKKGGGLHKLF